MAIIDSVIRKKKLIRERQWQERERAITAVERSVRECSVASREHSEVLRYLWLQLEGGDSLSVQVLVAARQEEARCKQRLASAESAHRMEQQKVAHLDAQIARVDKDLEKLEERRAEQRAAVAQELAARDALLLDEWVLGRHGRGEGA